MKSTPTKLEQITLRQWVDFYNMYGKDLEKRFADIQKMPEGEDRNNEYMLYDWDNTLYTYSYYTGIPMDKVMKMDLKAVIMEQGSAFISLKKEEVRLTYRDVYEWNGHQWMIQPIYMSTSEKLTYEQFQKTQDLALIISDLQDGKQEAIYCLCAAYLRRINEEFTEDLVHPSSNRVKLMQSLPLNLALRVKKYFEDSVKLYLHGNRKDTARGRTGY